MKWYSSLMAYMYCISRLSIAAVGIISPARKVFSTVEPDFKFFSLVRTKAAPLPGFTCWNSITDMGLWSTMIVLPGRRSLLEIMAATVSFGSGDDGECGPGRKALAWLQ